MFPHFWYLVPHGQFEAQEVVTRDTINRCLAAPAFAAQFPGDSLEALSHRSSELFAQIKIAPDAFSIGAIKPEDRSGMSDVDAVLDFAGFAGRSAVEKPEIHCQTFQVRKSLGQAL